MGKKKEKLNYIKLGVTKNAVILLYGGYLEDIFISKIFFKKYIILNSSLQEHKIIGTSTITFVRSLWHHPGLTDEVPIIACLS